jgi:hypothetical protein
MLARIDAALLNIANRLATYWQEQLGLTMPIILRHATMAMMVSTLFAIAATFLFREPFAFIMMLVLGGVTIRALMRSMSRYARDAEKDWSSDMARDYMVRAIGATEGQRSLREISVILMLVMVPITIMMMRVRSQDIVDIAMLLLMVATLAHLYLICAEPRPPGTGRRETHGKLAWQGSR